MAQSTTNLGKIHVFPSETLYNQFKDIIADNDLALLKDDGAYIVAALLEQNGYVKFSNGLILQWGLNAKDNRVVVFPIGFSNITYIFIYSLNYGSDRVLWEEVLPSDSANITSATYRTENKQKVGPCVGNWVAIGI